MTDYKALCAELIDELHGYASANPHHDSDELVARARLALAEPEPPDDGEAKTLRELALKELDAWSEERNGPGESIICDGLAVRLIRDALAAEPEPPTDDELLKLTENVSTEHLYKHRSLPSDWDPGDYASSPRGLIEFARAVLQKWGPTITP